MPSLLSKILPSRAPRHEQTPPPKRLVISEGVAGYWHYHLSVEGRITRGLCGAETMYTSIPLERWGVKGPSHLPKSYTYCKECEKARDSAV